MKKLLKKDLRLCATPLTYAFIAFGLLTFFPGYPILMVGFFVCLGLYHSFQGARESNDLLYTALLPVAKADVVKSKYLFCAVIELSAFTLSAAVTLLRMTVFVDSALYRGNFMMNANPAYLGLLLLLFGLFDTIFLGGFFRTGYSIGKPFLRFCIVALIYIGAAETLHHLPGLEAVNAFGLESLPLQLGILLCGLALSVTMTVLSCRSAIRAFEKTDLSA